MEFFKVYKQHLVELVHPFIVFVRDCFERFHDVVLACFPQEVPPAIKAEYERYHGPVLATPRGSGARPVASVASRQHSGGEPRPVARQTSPTNPPPQSERPPTTTTSTAPTTAASPGQGQTPVSASAQGTQGQGVAAAIAVCEGTQGEEAGSSQGKGDLASQGSFGRRPEQNKTYRKAMESFKVTLECPIIVMFLYQIFRTDMSRFMEALMPSMIRALTERAPDHVAKISLSLAGSPAAMVFGAQSSVIQECYLDFISCQIKTLTLVVYIFRNVGESKTKEDREKEQKEKARQFPMIPSSIVYLLRRCPHDAMTMRKELLIAVRHVLATVRISI